MENNIEHIIAREFTKTLIGASYQDKNNILWKYIDDVFIGKRSVFCNDLSYAWLGDVNTSNIRSWLCGIDSDYEEIFYSN